MRALLGLLTLVLHAGLMAAAALALAGAAPVLRARVAGCAGPPILQPLRDLRRLARKHPVLPENASPLLAMAPLVALAACAAAALLVPSFTLGMATAPVADLIVLAGLLAAARAALALAGLDTGAAWGGLGAGRAIRAALLAEPALLLVVFAVATVAGSTNLDSVAGAGREAGSGLPLALAAVAAGLVVVAEPGGGDAGLSGWHLAAVEMAAGVRRLVWLSLLVAVFAPAGIAAADSGLVAWLLGAVAWAAKMAVLAAALTLVEAACPAPRTPELLGVALLLGLLAAVFLFAGQGLA